MARSLRKIVEKDQAGLTTLLDGVAREPSAEGRDRFLAEYGLYAKALTDAVLERAKKSCGAAGKRAAHQLESFGNARLEGALAALRAGDGAALATAARDARATLIALFGKERVELIGLVESALPAGAQDEVITHFERLRASRSK